MLNGNFVGTFILLLMIALLAFIYLLLDTVKQQQMMIQNIKAMELVVECSKHQEFEKCEKLILK